MVCAPGETVALDGSRVKLTILGPPVTKKNSGIIMTAGPKCPHCEHRTGRSFVLPSPQYQAWEKKAVVQIQRQIAGAAAFAVPVNCRALIYRERAVGDANNYYAAVADALEAAKIVTNDRLIVSWDGSRLLKDDANPRVEILLAPVDDATHTVVRRWRPRAEQAALPLAAPSPLDDADVPIS